MPITNKRAGVKYIVQGGLSAFTRMADGLSGQQRGQRTYAGSGTSHGDMYEVAIWKDMLKVEGDELYYAYLVDNQAIIIPKTIDAIRALTGIESNPRKSIDKTNRSLGITQRYI